MEEKVIGKVLKFGVFIASVLLFVAMPGCKSDDEPGGDGVRKELSFTPDERAAIDAFNEVGLSVMRQPGILSEDKNLVVSPISLVPVLAMYVNGLDQAGQSRFMSACSMEGKDITSLNKVVYRMITDIPQSDNRNKFNLANAMWINDGVDLGADYRNVLQNDLKVSVNTTDLSGQRAKTEIDNWCSKNTSGMIKDVFKPEAGLSLFMVNAMFFDGKWKNRFNAKSTAAGTFYNSDGTQSEVKMMRDKRTCPYYKGADYAMARLPYMCDSYYAVILLPDEGVSLASVVNSLTPEDIVAFAGDRLNRLSLDISLPKLDFGQRKISLTRALLDMGILSADDNLAGVAGRESQLPDFEQHTAFIVDESGTKAAAVTTGGIDSALPIESAVFKVDRPYLFMVVHNDSKAIIVEALINKL